MSQPNQVEKNCLIIDDDPIFVAMLEQTLNNHGVENVRTAYDGRQGLEVMRDNLNDIHAVTLDLNMPNEDGIGFLTSASKLGYRGEIILSSSEHQSVRDSALQLARMLGLNCQTSFAKPVDFEAVAQAVMQVEAMNFGSTLKQNNKTVIDVALSELRIEAHFQARIELNTMAISGAEVLARIRDNDGNYLNTQDVIEHAERTGKIGDLTWKMLENLVEGAHTLNQRHNRQPELSVNINGLLMASPGFSSDLIKMFKQADIDPRQIVLEITETGIPPEPAAALEAFARIRMHGFGIAIDDFGTGYSNIENLRLFPFTELKIDKSFVSNAQNDPFSRECIAAGVRLAEKMNLDVVAEGIETEYDLQLVKSHNIKCGQGYLFAKPTNLEDFSTYYAMDFVSPEKQVNQSNLQLAG